MNDMKHKEIVKGRGRPKSLADLVAREKNNAAARTKNASVGSRKQEES